LENNRKAQRDDSKPNDEWTLECHIFTERCLVTQISNLTVKAIKKWTIRVGFAVWEA